MSLFSRVERAPIVEVRDIAIDRDKTRVVHHASLDIYKGFTAIVGPNGSGKSTLATTIHGLQRPAEGVVRHTGILEGNSKIYENRPQTEDRRSRIFSGLIRAAVLETQEDRKTADYRSRYLGYIAQNPFLDPQLTAGQYINLIHRARQNKLDAAWVDILSERLGVSRHLYKTSSQLSGGEAQRVAIVAALAHEPKLVVADEPTSALDSVMSDETLKLFRDITCETETSIICVSHDPNISEFADRIITMRDGRVITS